MKTIFSWKMESYLCDRSFPSGEGKMGFLGGGRGGVIEIHIAIYLRAARFPHALTLPISI